MSGLRHQPPSPADRLMPLLRIAAVAGLLAALALVLVTTLRGPLKDDIAWLLYVADQWLAGRRLYVDLVEVNPPLIVWLCAIPVSLAHALGVAPKLVAMPAVAALILGCAWWTAELLRAPRSAPRSGELGDRVILFAVIGSVLLLLPGVEFGQREHLLAAMALPYLALLGAERCGAPRPPGHAAAIGLLAAIGCALKPQYLLAFGAAELFAVWRGLRLIRPASVAAAATIGLYILAVALLTPSFFRDAVPMALGIYGAGDAPLRDLLWDCRFLLLGLAAASLLLATSRRTAPEAGRLTVVFIFAAVATLACVIQGKNWFYHRLPATISTVLGLLGLISLQARRDGWRLDWRTVGPALLATLALALFGQRAYDRLHPQIDEALRRETTTEYRLGDLIRREHAHSYMAFSEWIALGFPVVNNTGVTWASRFDSMWPLHDLMTGQRVDPATARAWPVADWVVADFLRTCPDIAVVDRRGAADYVATLGAARPAFRLAWQLYHPIAAFGRIVVFRNRASPAARRAKGCGSPPAIPVAQAAPPPLLPAATAGHGPAPLRD